MTGTTTATRGTHQMVGEVISLFEEYSDIRLPKDVQARRVASVLENELTEAQRDIVIRVMRGEPQVQIAREKGVDPSTVSRTYKRGINRLKRFLRY